VLLGRAEPRNPVSPADLSALNEMSIDRSLVILGNGGHASSVAEAAESAGFAIRTLWPISGTDDSFADLISRTASLDLEKTALALGVGTNFVREAVHASISEAFPTARFPSIVHKTAWLSPSASIESGAVMLAHASAGAKARLSAGSLLNTGASLDHDSTLGEFASLGPGARTGGTVKIGPRTMIGLQAGILQGRTVSEDSVVGAQSLVLEDIPSLSVAIGSPCRVSDLESRTSGTTDRLHAGKRDGGIPRG